MYENLPTPSVVVELDTVERNIRAMLENAARYIIAHRPHIKTHRSVRLANMQLGAGASGITCAKLGEAEVMADAGIDDILIAYALIGEEKWERYASLFTRCRSLRTIVNSDCGAQVCPAQPNGTTRCLKCCSNSTAERSTADSFPENPLFVLPSRSINTTASKSQVCSTTPAEVITKKHWMESKPPRGRSAMNCSKPRAC